MSLRCAGRFRSRIGKDPSVEASDRPSSIRADRLDARWRRPDPLHPGRLLADLPGLPRDPRDDRAGRAADPGRLRDLPRPAQPPAGPQARLPGRRLRRRGARASARRSIADYKANRAEMPDDLVPQIPVIRRVFEGFRVPVLIEPGNGGRRRHRDPGPSGRGARAGRLHRHRRQGRPPAHQRSRPASSTCARTR